jgi:hypothetical protein
MSIVVLATEGGLYHNDGTAEGLIDTSSAAAAFIGRGDNGAVLPVRDEAAFVDAFAALPAPILERILGEVFEAGSRGLAARAQLSLVCRFVL